MELFDQFLDMCIKTGITINPKKVRFGYEDEQFYGYRLNKGRITPVDRNLDPVRRMSIPKNRSELRSVMGVFNQFHHFVDGYGKKNTPASIMSELSSTKVPFTVTPKLSKRSERSFWKMNCTYTHPVMTYLYIWKQMGVRMAGGQCCFKKWVIDDK